MNIEMNIDSNQPKIKKSRPSAANFLILGDLSGKSQSEAATEVNTGIRNMFTLDPNKLDAAIARINPTVELTLDSKSLIIPMTSMESFHPDALLELSELFESAPDVEASIAEQAAPSEKSVPTTDSNEDDFSRLLGGTKAAPGATSPAVKSTLEKLIADAVASDTTPAPAADKEASSGRGARLREVLRAEPFQKLESTWRSVQWFGENIDYDETASLWLVDADIDSIDAWSDDLLRRVAAGPGSAVAIIVLHNYSDAERSKLQALGRLASSLNAVAFAGASNSIAGLKGDIDKAVALDASDFDKAAEDSTSELSSIALGYPGILLRQPYGKRSDPIDTFDFDELGVAPDQDAFLWGSASVVLALMWLTDTPIIDDALLVTYDDGSGQAIKPPTGAYMTDSAADALLQRGLVPLLAERGGTRVRAPRLQSMAITGI